MNEIQIEYLPITELTPYSKNARSHSKEDINEIATSIKKYGMNDPIGIWGEKNIIVEGHGRMLACLKLGIDKVPVIRLDHLSDEERREYAILHNKTAELSAWDFEILKEEYAVLDFSDFNIDWGFTETEDAEVVEDDYDKEPPAVPKTKLGDIYQLGRHRLMCGDSTDLNQVEQLMNGAQADMLLTDPPYGVSYQKEGSASEARARHRNLNMMSLENDDLDGEDFLQFLTNAFSVLWAADRKQSTILEFDKPHRNDIHPTMKPVKLFDYQMKNNTKGGDIVLDLFGGSGTTIIAAEQNGRCGYCCELDPKYCDAILDRYISYKGSADDVFLLRDGVKIPYSEI